MMTACFVSLSFAGLVVLARSMNPIPSRTRPLNSSAPMVLWLKPWESRSLPGLPKTKQFLFTCHDQTETPLSFGKAAFLFLRAAASRIFAADRRLAPSLFSHHPPRRHDDVPHHRNHHGGVNINDRPADLLPPCFAARFGPAD